MNVIWKFHLALSAYQMVEMPIDSRALCVQAQSERPCLWMLVDPDAPTQEREVMVVGTGHPFNPQGFAYVGTFQIEEFVWHVFIREE